MRQSFFSLSRLNHIQVYKELFQQDAIMRFVLVLLSFPFQVVVWSKNIFGSGEKKKHFIQKKLSMFHESAEGRLLQEKLLQQKNRKNTFLNQNLSQKEIEKETMSLYYEQARTRILEQIEVDSNSNKEHFIDQLESSVSWMKTPVGFILSLLLGLPMHVLVFIYARPIAAYILKRLFFTIIVVIGVTAIVFTLLYLSPSRPAQNILGEQATVEQIENFNAIHGLNDPYLVQLGRTIRGIFTFDIGNSFSGNENVVSIILRRFPVTWNLTLMALLISVVVALPAGIYAAVKMNSTFDHFFMLIALVGISIPSFWQGLVFILTFSIRLGWLPATYRVGNWVSLLMPAIVLGTGLMASVSRMTRSSMLEVINEDYILTARSKGLPQSRVILRHAVINALIPIVTLIGLQFGGMLGGAAITEQVFNINGIGSFIVDRQFIPDIPAVMGGVIYVAITISLVNLFIDLLYNLLDPRIRSRIKKGRS